MNQQLSNSENYENYFADQQFQQHSEQISMQVSRSHVPLSTIKIIRLDKRSIIDEQLIENVDFQALLVDDGRFQLFRLLRYIQVQHFVMIEGREIMLFCGESGMFINFGIFPMIDQAQLQVNEYEHENMIIVKLQNNNINLIHLQLSRDHSDLMMKAPPKLINIHQPQAPLLQKSIIKKTHKIAYIIKKVLSSKRKNKQKKKKNKNYSDDQISEGHTFSKKSIEDYYYQIKVGYNYNFDFNGNSSKYMKDLRKFVRDNESNRRVKEGKKQERQEKQQCESQLHNIKSIVNKQTAIRSQSFNLYTQQQDI